MKHILKSALVASMLLAPTSIASATTNTVFRVGVPPVPGSEKDWDSISTNQIDAALTSIGGGLYPTNYTSDLAEELMQDLAGLKQSLENDIAAAIAGDSDVKQVYSVAVDMNPFKAKFSQSGTSIGLDLININMSVDLELHTQAGILGSIFCPSPDVDVDLSHIKISSSYNVYTGQVGGFNAEYGDIDVDSDCGGLLGPIGDAFDQWFVDEQGEAENAVENAVSSLNNITSKVTVFSIRDFTEAILDSNLFQKTGSDLTIDTVDEVLAQTDLDSGLIIDFEIDDGTSENTFSLTARTEAPVLGEKQGSGTTKQLPITYPAGADTVSIYVSDHGGPLTFVTTTSAASINVSVNQASHLVFVAVAHSNIVPGLRSQLSNASYFLGGSTGGGGPRS